VDNFFHDMFSKGNLPFIITNSSLYKKGRPNMDPIQSKINNEKSFAETCRLALEKSYGTQIPMPKSLAKKH